MKMHIKEFAKLTGVSVRTLHYYDEINLLKPSFVDEQNGYRCYDEKSLMRMQEILFYRELDFPLKSIINILHSPNYDRRQALARQKELLMIKRKRLDRLISVIDDSMKGVNTMNTDVFDNTEFESARKAYMQEAQKRWGNTEAYKESVKRTEGYSDEKWKDVNKGLEEIFMEFSDCLKSGLEPLDKPSQLTVKKLQDYISDNCYKCTNEILSGLGMMYVEDESFKTNIDKCGRGTAEFVSKAIQYYCR